ncbi:MAG: hypothetical protein JWQ02_4142 [Capsulimonas sp.]|jgi:hypothetical protein|nr:hypothetical protein [Capsulimonas sp.]
MNINPTSAVQAVSAPKTVSKAKDSDGDNDGGAAKPAATPAAAVEISPAAQQAYHAGTAAAAKHKKGLHTHLPSAAPAPATAKL